MPDASRDAGARLSRVDAALKSSPERLPLLIERARCLIAQEQFAEALDTLARARVLADHDPPALDAIGATYAQSNEYQRALEAYDRVIAVAPNHAAGFYNRAAMRRILGDLRGAEDDYDRAIALNPADHEAYLNRTQLRVQTRERNHIAELSELLGRPLRSWRSEVQLRYALAKELEDIGEYRESWKELSRGATVRRQNLTYDIEHDLQTVEWIREAFVPTELWPPGCDSIEPIFIVGLPRSGTTLVERILSSHSQVTGAGELDSFAHALLATVASSSGASRMPRRMLIERSVAADFASMGAEYARRTRRVAGATPRFTDKMPLNYLYCGLIRRALPRAKVVHVTRHPLAVCHAMYKTLFRQGYPFSYSLEEIGQYYLGYEKLMRHWRETLPGFMHELCYEQLVSNQEVETRRLLDYCGLSWEASCLSFERNVTPTATASASQVRRALYDTSVALWQRYASELGGLRKQLQAGGLRLD